MFAILMDRKGFHKVVEVGNHQIRTIRWAAMDMRRPIAPIEDLESVEMEELVFQYERQLSFDTFLYREDFRDNTEHARSQANET
jgi:hypothetical protein